MVKFLSNANFIYNKRMMDPAFADRKNRAWEELAPRLNVGVKVLMTSFGSVRMSTGKLRQMQNDQCIKEMTEQQEWIWDRLLFQLPQPSLQVAVPKFPFHPST